MKTKNIWTLAVTATLGLTACSNEIDTFDNNTPLAEIPICFNVGVNDPETRATHVKAESIKDFGVQIKTVTGNSDDLNRKYTQVIGNNQQPKWTSDEVSTWDPRKHTVDIMAYTPYALYENADPFIDTHNFFIETVQKDDSYLSDIMYCRINGFDPSTINASNPSIDLKFVHLLSLMEVTLNFNGFTANAIQGIDKIHIQGIKISGNCDLTKTNPLITTSGDFYNNVTTSCKKVEGQKVTFSSILIPQTIKSGGLTISFTANNKYYEWTSNQEITFKENTIHTLNINVDGTRTNVQKLKSRSWTE